MATYYEVPPLETYWNSQSDTLKEIREQLGYDSYPVTQQYKPLPDRHPLLQNVARKKPGPQRQGSTPPAQLPKIRSTPPPETSGHESPSLHSSRYNVIPPLKSKRAFVSPVPQKPDANDSWGEEESSDEEAFPMPGYHGYPYPMVMYPYPLVMAPPLQVTSHKTKSKKGKKKVRYQNTPVYLSSREHTKHEPTLDSSQREPSDQRPNSVLQRYQYQPVTSSNQPLPPSHPYYPASFYYCEDFLDEEIPNLVREVVHDASCQVVVGQMLRQQNKHDALEEFLNSLLEDVIYKETTSIVIDVAKDIVNEHMEKAAAYDMIQDMIHQVIHEMGPDVIDEALTENMLDDLLEENVIEQEISEQSQEVAVEVLTHYSNKVRNRDIRQIKSSSGEKLKDSLCLDYLLAYIARQGELWTEGEHANKLLDEITLNILLTEFAGVQQKKQATVDNKPVRRHYEKIVTDVTLDVLLEEISQSLDEDMADLDEYEMGLENPDINYKMPKELKKLLEVR